MNNRTLSARANDFKSLIDGTQDSIPVKAVRKLYNLTQEALKDLMALESKLDTMRTTATPLKPFPIIDISKYTKQIKEMAKEIEGLKKELEITKRSRDGWEADALRETINSNDKKKKIEELKSDKWYTPLWNK